MRPSPFDPMMLTPSQIAYPFGFSFKISVIKYKKSNYKQQDDVAMGKPVHAAIANVYIMCLINKL